MRKSLLILPISFLLLSGCTPSGNDSSFIPPSSSEFTPLIPNGNYPLITWDESQYPLRKGVRGLEFFSLNDFHGSVSENGSEPGIAKISTYLKKQRETYKDEVVFVNAGDMWQGSADSNITRGKLVNEWLNLLDCKAMSIGNHEFDWKIDTILNNIEDMNFPLLGANVVNKDDGEQVDYLLPYTTFTQNGINVGVIGTIGEGLTSSILAENVKDVEFAWPDPYVVNYSRYLKANGADVILYLTHDEASSVSSNVIANVDGVFLGHSHQHENEQYGNIPLIQASCNGKAIGQISLDYDFNNRNVINRSGRVNYFEDLTLLPDVETTELHNYYLENYINEVKNEVVGYAKFGIGSDELPYLMSDYMSRYYNENSPKYDISFSTHNQARSSIDAGDITYGDIYKSFPFDNALTVIEIKGSEVEDFLNKGSYYGVDGMTINDISYSETYYVLTIDYMSQKYITYNQFSFREVETLFGTYPRDVFKQYIGFDYPMRNQ